VCTSGRLQAVKALLLAAEDVEALLSSERPYSDIPLHVSGTPEVARALLAAGARVDGRDSMDVTALHRAAEHGDAGIVSVLLEAGADARDPDSAPLYEAHGAECIELLVAAGADVNAGWEEGRSPLHRACREGDECAVEALLRLGADATLGDPLSYAAWGASIRIIQRLLDNGADLRSSDALCSAAERSREATEYLLSLGCDVNAPGPGGSLPLAEAAGGGKVEIVDLLLFQGAQVNAVESDGRTALMAACGWGSSMEVVRLLVEHGADTNLVDRWGSTALLRAIGQSGCCEECGYNPNAPAEVIELLLEAGANPWARWGDGETLVWAWPAHRERVERARIEWRLAHPE
jgi:serine/threonine-protein phosphatase 6 regulatory ankyrin repeat subunit B